MSNAVAQRARAVSADSVQGQSLRIVPIIGPSHDQPIYELLRSETVDFVKISEVNDSGDVPTLQVSNALDERVFLMDGQELVGAKQNRILNTDVIVPAKARLCIPVSCVEQGRWNPVSAQFSQGKSSHYSTRRAKAERVRDSLKDGRGHDADQHAVWDEVAACLTSTGSFSPTQALSAAYATRQRELNDFRQTLCMPDRAVGLAVFHGGRFRGLDLFDRHSTLKHFWESLLDSYAIDLLSAEIGPADANLNEADVISQQLQRAADGRWETFASPGEGADWRLDDDQLSGAALVWEQSVVLHLQLFPRINGQEARTREYRPRIRRRYAS